MSNLPQIRLEDLPPTLGMLWASYECQDGSGHTHNVGGDIFEDGIEGTAMLLADAVSHCEGHVDKHGVSHGFPHSQEVADKAYHSGVAQLLTNSAEMEYQELKRKIFLYEKWGGHMPAIATFPDKGDPSKWWALIPHPVTGEAHLYPVQPGVFDEFPDPREFGAKPSDVMGWKMPQRSKKHG